MAVNALSILGRILSKKSSGNFTRLMSNEKPRSSYRKKYCWNRCQSDEEAILTNNGATTSACHAKALASADVFSQIFGLRTLAEPTANASPARTLSRRFRRFWLGA